MAGEKYEKEKIIKMKINDTDMYMAYDTRFIPKKFMEKCLRNIEEYFRKLK